MGAQRKRKGAHVDKGEKECDVGLRGTLLLCDNGNSTPTASNNTGAGEAEIAISFNGQPDPRKFVDVFRGLIDEILEQEGNNTNGQ